MSIIHTHIQTFETLPTYIQNMRNPSQIERLLARKNKKSQRREVKYVVAKKSANRGRPAGVKGAYKMVDGRMKKDTRAMKRAAQKKSGKKR